MRLKLVSPTKLLLSELSPKELSELTVSWTYTDKKVSFEIQRLKKAKWFNPDLQDKIDLLKKKEKVCLLTQEPDGTYSLPAGLRRAIEDKYGTCASREFQYPEPQLIPWAQVPEHKLYPYQKESLNLLLEEKHGRVELGTGLGKSFIALNVAKELGLKTIVMSPSSSITEQLYNDFLKHFGKKYVGAYFEGKKEFKKLFVIGNGQSFTRVEPGSEAWEELSKAQVFIADESHQCPAATLNKVCFGLAADAPYRFFFSATQMRNDGLDKLLDGISGRTVYSKTVREGVDEGYLAKPVFRMIDTHSDLIYDTDDANEMTRKHLYYNPRVIRQAAEIANLSVERLGHQVLILVDEIEQFTRLLGALKHVAKFAHGPLQAGNVDKVPVEYRDDDPNDLVRRFNAREFPILVGTSCISTGTNILSVKTCIYLKGGKSEIEVKQGIGRCTRLMPEIGKTACTIVDFDVTNVSVLTKHAHERKKIYEEIYGPVNVVELTT